MLTGWYVKDGKLYDSKGRRRYNMHRQGPYRQGMCECCRRTEQLLTRTRDVAGFWGWGCIDCQTNDFPLHFRRV